MAQSVHGYSVVFKHFCLVRVYTYIGVDIFGIHSKSGRRKKFISLSHEYYLTINIHYTLEKLYLMRFSNKFIILIEILTNYTEFVLSK